MDMNCPDQQDAGYESNDTTPSGVEDELGTRKRLEISRIKARSEVVSMIKLSGFEYVRPVGLLFLGA